jgi:hypothetical protein
MKAKSVSKMHASVVRVHNEDMCSAAARAPVFLGAVVW